MFLWIFFFIFIRQNDTQIPVAIQVLAFYEMYSNTERNSMIHKIRRQRRKENTTNPLQTDNFSCCNSVW